MRLCTQIMEFEARQAYKIFETGVLVGKSKKLKPNQPFFLILALLCLKMIDKLICLMAFIILNVKLYQQYMREGSRKIEATGSTRYQKTYWNKIDSNRTS